MILGIETATRICSVALMRQQELVAEYRLNIKNAHQRRIVGAIQTLFRDSDTAPDQLTAIAVSIGPGSFTGLRIGLSLAKGLAMPFQLPLIPVPTLQALAAVLPPAPGPVSVILRSKADEVYAAAFDGETLCEQLPVKVMPVSELADYLPADSRLTGQCDRLPAQHPFQVVPIAYRQASAAAVARMAGNRNSQEPLPDPEELEPNYLADFIAGQPKSYF